MRNTNFLSAWTIATFWGNINIVQLVAGHSFRKVVAQDLCTSSHCHQHCGFVNFRCSRCMYQAAVHSHVPNPTLGFLVEAASQAIHRRAINAPVLCLLTGWHLDFDVDPDLMRDIMSDALVCPVDILYNGSEGAAQGTHPKNTRQNPIGCLRVDRPPGCGGFTMPFVHQNKLVHSVEPTLPGIGDFLWR